MTISLVEIRGLVTLESNLFSISEKICEKYIYIYGTNAYSTDTNLGRDPRTSESWTGKVLTP